MMLPAPLALERVRTVTEYSEWSNSERGSYIQDSINVSEVSRDAVQRWPCTEQMMVGVHPQFLAPALVYTGPTASEIIVAPADADDGVLPAQLVPSGPGMPSTASSQERQGQPQHQHQHQEQQQQPIQNQRKRSGRGRRFATASQEPASDACQKQMPVLLEQLEGSSEACAEAIAELPGRVWRLSCERTGCRVIQKAIEVAPESRAAALVSELHSHVRALLASPYGNYVIQKVVEAMPCSSSAFIAVELLGAAAETARHRYGCRILIRLIEHTAAEPSTARLIDELLRDAQELCLHKFGHHIIQAILAHSVGHRHQIAMVLVQDARATAKHREGSYVLEKAMVHCAAEDQDRLVESLTAGGIGAILDLAQDQYACFVVKSLAGRQATATQQRVAVTVLQHISSAQGQLMQTNGGTRLVKDLAPKLAMVAVK